MAKKRTADKKETRDGSPDATPTTVPPTATTPAEVVNIECAGKTREAMDHMKEMSLRSMGMTGGTLRHYKRGPVSVYINISYSEGEADGKDLSAKIETPASVSSVGTLADLKQILSAAIKDWASE